MEIALDVDGPLADIHTEWIRRYNRDYNDTFTVEQITEFDWHKIVKPECGRRIYDYLNDADLYAFIPMKPGSQDGVKALRAMGHGISFVTACTKGMTDQKVEWLERHGYVLPALRNGVDFPDELIVARRKSKIIADLLIDDALHNINEWTVTGRRAILMNFPWNNKPVDHPELVHRAHGWGDVLDLVRSFA